MGAKFKVGLVAGLVIAAMAGGARSASAKRISGWLQNQNLTDPDGTVYTTCVGDLVWGQVYGFDSNGNYTCGIRSESNGQFLTSTTCGTGATGAVTYQSWVKSSQSNFCTAASTSWNGPWAVCTVTGGFFVKNRAGACTRMDLTVFGRGYGT